jgi:5-methylcytosine-specific restriction enzyme subunit McrC
MLSRKRIRVSEFGRVLRTDLGVGAWRQLRTLDEHRLRTRQPPIFDWNYREYARCRNMVGVVQTPNVVIEILPKIDPALADDIPPNAARNLVHMLHVCGNIPTHSVGSAGLEQSDVELLDVFVQPFATRLLHELLKGAHRDYSRYEAERPHVKGQILLQDEMRRPPWMRHRVAVRFDEYDANSVINRTIKAATGRMLELVRDQELASLLSRILDEMDEVEDRMPGMHEIRAVQFDRMSDRFRQSFEFSASILLGESPTPRPGELHTFSIVFPMDVLFEQFFARSLIRHAKHIGLQPSSIHPQARGRRRRLLQSVASGKESMTLRPDVVIDDSGGGCAVVIDTKWKRLVPDSIKPMNGIDESDAYQVVSYAVRHDCNEVVLVYPRLDGVSEKCFIVPGLKTKLRIALFDLRRDLGSDAIGLRRDLSRVVFGQVAA